MSEAEEPIWLDGDLLFIDLQWGLPGLTLVRPEEFSAAIHAPKAAFFYGEIVDPCHLAAIYAHRIAKAHAFLDGNKRTAITAALTFLAVNGIVCAFKETQADDALIALTTDMKSVEDFGCYLRDSIISNIE